MRGRPKAVLELNDEQKQEVVSAKIGVSRDDGVSPSVDGGGEEGEWGV